MAATTRSGPLAGVIVLRTTFVTTAFRSSNVSMPLRICSLGSKTDSVRSPSFPFWSRSQPKISPP